MYRKDRTELVKMKRKRFVKILISSLLVLSLGTGCGKFGKVDHLMEQTYVSGYEEMQYNVDPDTPFPMSAARMDAPDTTGWDESKKIYAYCWDTDFESKLNLVLERFPEYKDYVEIIVTGQGGTSYEYKTSDRIKYNDIITVILNNSEPMIYSELHKIVTYLLSIPRAMRNRTYFFKIFKNLGWL